MECLVRLEGDNWSLEYLPRRFSQSDHRVRAEGGKHYLSSLAFAHCATSGEVWDLAEQIVERINGATKAFAPHFCSAQVGDEIVEVLADGTRRVHQRMRIGTTHLVLRSGEVTLGEQSAPQLSKAEKLVAKWEAEGHESDLGRALRIGLLPQQTWGALYHVYEVIKHDVSRGRDLWEPLLALLPNEPDLGRELKRFRNTANNPAHAGVHARHGRPERRPEPHPIAFADAQSLIRRLFLAWLSTKI